MEHYRRLFPITERLVYLDHASMGPLSKPAIDAQMSCLERQASCGSEAAADFRAARNRLRASVATFIGAGADELAFTKNTPEGLSFVAAGLDWRPGDSVVTTDLEFPANIYPWLNLQRRGVEVRIVPSEAGRVPVERLIAALDSRTRALAVSYVQFSTGYRVDLSRLAEACRPRGVFLVSDVMQAIGALPIDVRALGVDFLACAAHKWLLGPFGMGLFYCRREMLDRLCPVEVGQGTMIERDSYLDYRLEYLPSAARFECGMFNPSGVHGLQAALDLLSQVEREPIWRQICRLNERLAEGLKSRGYQVVSSLTEAERSGIISFRSDRHESGALHRRLHEAGVVVSLREGLVRVSPHFYNSADDVETLLTALP